MRRSGLTPLCCALACATAPEPQEDLGPPVTQLVSRLDCPTGRPRVRTGSAEISSRPPPALVAGEVAAGRLVLTHGGVGSAPELADGPGAAAGLGLTALTKDAPALEAVLAAVVHLEDDPRFNAGTGSHIRLDGQTIQMDAAVATSAGAFAAVAAIERVKNPVLVARAVLETPHVLLVGEGATRFAHRRGFPDERPTCPEAEARYQDRLRRVQESLRGRGEPPAWKTHWNFPGAMPAELLAPGEHGDTVGAVARDGEGAFAAALSTGGTSVTMYGRSGDVPIYGAGLYAGPAGAVASTGEGEVIIRELLARAVYERLAAGVPAREAVERAVLDFPRGAGVGLIAVDAVGWGVAANRAMAYGLAKE